MAKRVKDLTAKVLDKIQLGPAPIQVKAYNDQPDVDKLNELLDQMMARPFTSSFIAVQSLRAALDLFGIKLPVLPIEQAIQGPSTIAALTMLHAGKSMPVPNPECEYAYKIVNASIDPGSKDEIDDLYLYFVVDLNDENGHYEAYAQIVTKEELDKLLSMDIPDMEHEYPDQVGDDNGETTWDQRIRHTGTHSGGTGAGGEHG